MLWLRALAIGLILTQVAHAQDEDPPVELEIEPDPPYGPEEPPPEPAPAPEPEPEPEPVEEETGLGPISGRVFTYARAQVDGDVQQLSASTWLEARPRFTDASSARISLAVDVIEASINGNRGLRGRLREAYVTYKKRGWLLRLGQQIIPWGSADVINPTDFLTARDSSFFYADSEDNREGAISLLVSKVFTGPGLEITVVATPVHAASRLLLPPSAIPTGITIGARDAGPVRLQNTELAAKAKLSGRGWDVALVGFRGYQHAPELELVSVDTIQTVNHRIWGGGLDGSASLGKLTFRLEAAYVVTENPDGKDPTIQPSYATGVLAVERPFFERVRVQLQIVGRAHPRWQSPKDLVAEEPLDIARREVAIGNALLLDYVDQVRGLATARIAYTSVGEKLELEVFGAINFFYADFLVRPKAAYHFTDAFTLEAGYEAYGGNRSRPLGALRPFSGGFLQGSFVF